MLTLTVTNAGKAIIYFQQARVIALSNYNRIQNCKACDKDKAQQWKDAADFYQQMIEQIRSQYG